jgi:hypothetical protein
VEVKSPLASVMTVNARLMEIRLMMELWMEFVGCARLDVVLMGAWH